MTLTDRSEAVFYDLLPYGMHFNASAGVTAGRLTSINGSYSSNDKAWSSADVTVTVGEDDVIDDWNGTGRTMVVFHLKYTGDNLDVFSEYSGKWIQGYGIHFQAYYNWTYISSAQAESNIAAYMSVDNSVSILGNESQVWPDDGSIASFSSVYAAFGDGDVDGDGSTTDDALYAEEQSKMDVATSAENGLLKLVKSDTDVFASYGSTASTGVGTDYTYEIILNNRSSDTLQDIVIFDTLENYTGTDQGGTVYSSGWRGTLTGVSVEGLKSQGIETSVYYSVSDRDSVVYVDRDNPDLDTADEVLTTANGWYTYDGLVGAGYSLSEVTAVAVDCRYSDASAGTEFKLAAGESLSFLIHMTSPLDMGQAEGTCAYNNATGYLTRVAAAGDTEVEAELETEAASVKLTKVGTVVAEKKFGATTEVPDSFASREFTFVIRNGAGEALSYQKYTLQTWDEESGEWINDSVVRAADIDGTFTLKAGQRAAFSNVAEYESVSVEEESPLSFVVNAESTVQDVDQDGADDVLWTFTNTWYPTLFVEKSVQMADELDADELAAYDFTFYVRVDSDKDGVCDTILKGADYYKVSEADASLTDVVTGSGTTDADTGYFTLKAGEIAAFLLDYEGQAYEVVEVPDADGDWTCEQEDHTVSGTADADGSLAEISNIYRYRSLIVEKDLTYQDVEDCTVSFTFTITDENGTALAGTEYTWTLIDADGNPLSSYTDAAGTVWATSGYLTDGTFTIPGAGAGVRIRIDHLAAGETYTVTESGYDTSLYQPLAGGTASATMSTWAYTRSVTITNRYLKRDLSVSKLAVSENPTADLLSTSFEMKLETYDPDNPDAGADGWVAVSGEAYTIDGSSADSNGTAYVTDADGKFSLKSGETAVFDDIGYVGDQYRVTETQNSLYPQVYPASLAPAEGTLTESGAELQIINGESGLVAVTKKLAADDDIAQAYIDDIRADNTAETLVTDPDAGTTGAYAVDAAVSITDASGEPYKGGFSWIYLSQSDGAAATEIAAADNTDGSFSTFTVKLYPCDYIFLAGIPAGYTVTVSETEEWAHQALTLTDAESAAILADVTGTSRTDVETLLSYTDSLSASAETVSEGAAVLTLTNTLACADAESVIYKEMTEESGEVSVGAEITFRVDVYDADNGTWSPAGGISYIVFDDAGAASAVLVTGTDGLITAAKTANGYPYLVFLNDDVKANIVADAATATGTLRIVEYAMDEEWGTLAGYISSSKQGDPSAAAQEVDTIINANDSGQVIRVVKQVDETYETEAAKTSFTFRLTHVLSASELPLTEASQILDSEAGAGYSYSIYDSDTGQLVGSGITDSSGLLTIAAGQYAEIYVPEHTVWTVSESTTAGWVLTEVSVDGEYAALEDGGTVALISEKPVQKSKISYTLTTGSLLNNQIRNNAVSVTFDELSAYGTQIANGDLTLVKNVGADTSTDLIYLYKNSAGTDFYVLSDGLIQFNADSSKMFQNGKKLTTISFRNIDTSNVTDMSYMFAGKESQRLQVTSLDFSLFDTSNVTDMTSMFQYSDLTSLDLSMLDTSKVQKTGYMFDGCSALKTLDLSKLDLLNVYNCSDMFRNCSSLTVIDLSGLFAYTSSVPTYTIQYAGSMFEGCSSLVTIYAGSSGWRGINKQYYSTDMFKGCTSLVGGYGATLESNGNVVDYTYSYVASEDKPNGYLTYKDASE